MKLLLISLSLTLYSCTNTEKKANNIGTPITTVEPALLKGAWQYCNKFKDYQLMEFGDSVFKYIEHEQYTGSTVPFRYTIKGDSLFLDSDETSDKRRWLIHKLDSNNLQLIDEYDTTICKKIKLNFTLHDYYYSQGKVNDFNFQELKKKYNCGK